MCNYSYEFYVILCNLYMCLNLYIIAPIYLLDNRHLDNRHLDNRHLDIRLPGIRELVPRSEPPRCIRSHRQPCTGRFVSSSPATGPYTLLERHYRRCSRAESNRCRSADRRLRSGSCTAAATK